MKKISKILCCLIVPVLAMFGLAGCGKARTSEDILNRYTEVKTKHTDMFKVDKDNPEALTDTIKVSYTGAMTNLNNLDTLESSFSNDINLYKRYLAIIELQDVILDNLFVYYEAQRNDFFGNNLLGVEKEEMRQLYNNVEKLEEDIVNFKVAKSQIEKTVDAMTFTGVVKADITSYAYQYNMFIEDCFEYVRYFKDLNTKYAYSGEVTEDNMVSYVKHYYEEAIFELTEVVYYKYVKALNNINECDLSYAINDSYEIILKANLYDKIYDSTGIIKDYDDFVDAYGKNTYSLDAVKANLTAFQEARESFMQKVRVFKQVFDNMDYYNYNLALCEGGDALENYKKDATNIESANIKLVESFYETTINDYINKLDTLKINI